MFDWFKLKKNKNHYSCELLNNSLAFFTDEILSCCSGYDGITYVEEPTNEKKVSWNKVLQIKKKNIELLRKGVIPDGCKGCYNIRPFKESKTDKFSHIVLKHFTQCNCGCVYCSEGPSTKGKIEYNMRASDYYDALPLIKDLYKNNLLDKDSLNVEFQGGDLAVLEEFEPLVEEFLTMGVNSFMFTTNNIIFQPIIVKALNQTSGSLVTSLDCGTKETYLKLKRVDKFEDYLENLRRYKAELKNDGSIQILVKYIIVGGLNDNFEELEKFFDYMAEIKVDIIQLEINYKDILIYKDNNFTVPEHYYEMFDYAKERCKQTGIVLSVWEYTQNILDKGKVNI